MRAYLLIGVFMACTFLLGGCGSVKQQIADAQKKIIGLQSTFAETFNQANQQKELSDIFKAKAAACKQYHADLSDIDLSKCPDDYKQAFGELTDIVDQMSKAFSAGDLEMVLKTKELDQKRISAAENLNRVAKDQGLTMTQ